MADKIFCGSGKIRKFDGGGYVIKMSLSADDVEVLRENLDNGWVNVDMCEKRQKVEGKPTHYLCIDQWKPTRQAAPPEQEQGDSGDDDGDYPF